MLHICNALQKSKYLENGAVLKLLTLTHRKSYLHTEPVGNKNYVFFSLQHLELFFISFGSVSEAIVQTVFIICQTYLRTTPWQLQRIIYT